MVQMEKRINGPAVHGLPAGRENLQKSMGPTPTKPRKEGISVQGSEARVARAMACDCNHQPMRRPTDIQLGRVLKWTRGFNVRVRLHYEKQGQEDLGQEKAKEDEGMTKEARGGGRASSAYPQNGRRSGEATMLGPIPVPPTTGRAEIAESGPKPARTEVGGVQSNPKTVARDKGHMSLVPHKNGSDGRLAILEPHTL